MENVDLILLLLLIFYWRFFFELVECLWVRLG